MGLFNKEPAEKKEYWKAFGDALKKPSADAFAALEAASRNWPTGWQGYFLMGLCYDLACGKLPFDPDKAAECHKLAKAAGKEAQDGYVQKFYRNYEKAAGNFRLEESFCPRAENVRKAGTAMLLCHDMDRDQIVTGIKSKTDRYFWRQIFYGVDTSSGFFAKMTEEQVQCMYSAAPFITYVEALEEHTYTQENRDAQVKRANKLIKESNKVTTLEKENMRLDTPDMYSLIYAFVQLTGGGPYLILNERGGSLRLGGWETLWSTAYRGSMSALHMLADMFADGDYRGEICQAFARIFSSHSTSEKASYDQIMAMLEMSAGKGDAEAVRLIHVIAES